MRSRFKRTLSHYGGELQPARGLSPIVPPGVGALHFRPLSATLKTEPRNSKGAHKIPERI
jgi:hypothetical protein